MSFVRLVLAVMWFSVLLMAPSTMQAATEKRSALIIGNADYAIGALPNPLNDARSIAAVLLSSGFQTTVVENADKKQFEAAIDRFAADLEPGSVALFYYAGHAFQSGGRNYLLPVDTVIGDAQKVMAQGVNASDIIARVHARGIEFGIFILDACRDNPFVKDGTEKGRGLASMESEGGETLIAFATQAGDVAYDGTGANSPYTGALVTELDKPGRDILDVFRAVRRSVRIWTNGQQRPFISASIERSFVFRPEAPGTATPPVETGNLTQEHVREVIEQIWWAAIQDSKLPDDFRAFVNHFPESTRVADARGLAQALEQDAVRIRGLDLVQFSVPKDQRDPNGLSAVITDCDILGGDPDDPRRVTDGVPWGLVNVKRAVIACAAALADDSGNPRLLHQMGRLLDIQGQYDQAEAFYKLAGAQDYSAALVNLGFLSVTARGRDRDYATAMKYYRHAADLGNLRARTNIGEMFERGWSVEPNLDEAVLWYRLAARNGWPNALDTLGNLYRRGRDEAGRGLDKNVTEAIRLYRIAAELDSTNAMNNLGQIYLSDEVGKPQVEEGLRWLTLASERGNRFASYNLGRQYRDGTLVKRDNALALLLFERAADLGFAPARIAIGDMYRTGQGVKRDAQEAAFQYLLATATADDKRPEQKDEAEKKLRDLKLRAADLDAAESRAKEWLRLNGG